MFMTRARVRKGHFTKKSKSLHVSANYRRRAKIRLGSHSCRRDIPVRTAAGLPQAQQGKAILIGIVAATFLRVLFAGLATQILQIVSLLLAGGMDECFAGLAFGICS